MATRQQASTVRVADVELEPLVIVGAGSSLAIVARCIDGSALGTVLVDTDPLSECTDRDLVRAMARDVDPATPVASLPLEPPLFVRTATPLTDALDAMWCENRASVLVIGRDGTPIGFLSAAVAFATLREGPSWLGALKVALQIEGDLR
jgi:signal-transduction protein with cAMP-binding, CBS, and nucleotidyltransferase domain